MNFKKIDFRERPELYRVGIGEQGVLLVEPYKSEILPFWKFRTPADAKISSQKILEIFFHYEKESDFAGMDMARKFLQMGYTRSRRYANHRSGRKYEGPSGSPGRKILEKNEDPIKARSAEIFKKAWMKVENNQKYRKLKNDWKLWYG